MGSATENNLARLIFNEPGAGFVTVSRPQLITGSPGDALFTRVRAWAAPDGQASFAFDSRLKTNLPGDPLILYLEGITNSSDLDDILFEYNYDDASGDGLCSGVAFVTVMSVDTERKMSNATDRDRLRANNKILRDAEMIVTAKIEPAAIDNSLSLNQEHRYGDFGAERNVSGEHRWTYTAGSLHTWFRDKNRHPTKLTIRSGHQPCCPIEVRQPLNVTVPHLLSFDPLRVTENVPQGAQGDTNPDNNLFWQSQYFTPQDNNMLLFDRFVRYEIQDQFGEPIIESAHDGSTVIIREEVPFRGHVSGADQNLQQWLDTMVQSHTSVNWREPSNEGQLSDHTHIRLPGDTLTTRQRFVVAQDQVILTMNGHVWSLGVRRGGRDTGTRMRATHNNLRVRIVRVDPDTGNIAITSFYQVFTYGPQ